MPIYVAPLTSKRANPRIGTTANFIELDAFINEDHTYSNIIPVHKTERGFSITDNTEREPIQLVVEAVVSTSSLDNRILFGNSPKRADDAYKKLASMWKRGSIVSVLTGLTTYNNLAITNISIPRNKETSGTLRATISFKEVRIARNTTVTIDEFATIKQQFLESTTTLGNVGFEITDTTFTDIDGSLKYVNSYTYNSSDLIIGGDESEFVGGVQVLDPIVSDGIGAQNPLERASGAGQSSIETVELKGGYNGF